MTLLPNKIALVTGAGRGISAAMVAGGGLAFWRSRGPRRYPSRLGVGTVLGSCVALLLILFPDFLVSQYIGWALATYLLVRFIAEARNSSMHNTY